MGAADRTQQSLHVSSILRSLSFFAPSISNYYDRSLITYKGESISRSATRLDLQLG